ncbi:MAG TPA: hypothetical protein VGO50_12890 [Pyrinomonadaceae bacterium]|jgi:hypothetical protein|nr:hypothetical protein [Pyrinomonadaceae bacterium]
MGNLGLGYLASVLRKEGYKVEVLDFQTQREEILRVVRRRPSTWFIWDWNQAAKKA